jgi:hypothetical protein
MSNAMRIRLFPLSLRLFGLLVPILAIPSASAQDALRVLIHPVEVLADIRLAEWSRGLARERLAGQIEIQIAQRLAREGHHPVPVDEVRRVLPQLQLKLENERERTPAHFERLGGELAADRVIYLQVLKVNQRDKSSSAILAAPARGGSDTEVEVRVWVYDRTSKILSLNGREPMRATLESPVFGTTRRSDMSGNPQDIGLIIDRTNSRRIEWMGRSVLQAVEAPFRALFPKVGNAARIGRGS